MRYKIFFRWRQWKLIVKWQEFSWIDHRVIFSRLYFGPVEVRRYD